MEHAQYKWIYLLEEIERGHAGQLQQWVESDVNFLKEGCMTFKSLFEALTGFTSFEHVTIT